MSQLTFPLIPPPQFTIGTLDSSKKKKKKKNARPHSSPLPKEKKYEKSPKSSKKKKKTTLTSKSQVANATAAATAATTAAAKAKEKEEKKQRAKEQTALFRTRLDKFNAVIASGILRENSGGGGCLVKALAQFCFGDEEKHHDLRMMICDAMKNGIGGVDFRMFIEDDQTLEEYISVLKLDETWMGEHACLAFALATRTLVQVYDDSGNYVVPLHYPSDESLRANIDEFREPIRLARTNENHYQLLEFPQAGKLAISLHSLLTLTLMH